MSLSAVAVRNAKPQDKPYKLTDGRGLYLLVSSPSGNADYFVTGDRRAEVL